MKPIVKAEWELETRMRRMRLRNPNDRKSIWKWNERHDKIVRKEKNDIDWYRYQKMSYFIQIREIISFKFEIMKQRKTNLIIFSDEKVSSVNEHTYNSLILNHSTRLIESIRSSSRLFITLHYWMLKESSTRKISFSQRSRRLFASKTRRKTMKFSRFLNNISNFQAFFDLTWKNSFIICQFLIYLLAFKTSSRCRCDTSFLFLFVCLQ